MLQNNKEKIVLLDFCETVASFQTADLYVQFTRKRYKNLSIYAKVAIHRLLWDLGIIHWLTRKYPRSSINKRMILWQLEGLSREQLELSAKEYYEQIVKPQLIMPMIEEIKRRLQDGYHIVIVSGGYDLYLKYFAEEYGIKDIQATKVQFKKDKCTGRFEGNDCLWDEKVNRINKLLNKLNICHSIAYSDSESDLPMMQWADEAVVVQRTSNSNHWAQKYGFKELYW